MKTQKNKSQYPFIYLLFPLIGIICWILFIINFDTYQNNELLSYFLFYFLSVFSILGIILNIRFLIKTKEKILPIIGIVICISWILAFFGILSFLINNFIP